MSGGDTVGGSMSGSHLTEDLSWAAAPRHACSAWAKCRSRVVVTEHGRGRGKATCQVPKGHSFLSLSQTAVDSFTDPAQ